jgi:arylsulfatase A-like enzyme
MSNVSFTAMALLDSNVKRIVDVLQAAGLARNATVIVVSDHGFRSFKHKIHPNVLLREKGLVTGEPGKASGDAWVASTGTPMVYTTDGVHQRPAEKERIGSEAEQHFQRCSRH